MSAVSGYRVDISSLSSVLDKLSPEEKDEQVRDWALYGLVSMLNLPPQQKKEILGTRLPVRYPHLKELATGEISPGRVRYISSSDALLLLSTEQADDLPLIGALLDEEVAAGKTVPRSLHIFNYTAGASSEPITVSYLRTIAGQDVFSPAYGFFEKEVRNLEDMRDFVEHCDDITLVRWQASSVVLGGRKYRGTTLRSLPLDAIAALYQAYNEPAGHEQQRRSAYNDFIARKYEEVVKNDKRLRQAIREGKVKSFQILTALRKKIPYGENGDPHVGFSLDPEKDLDKIADDLTRIARKDPGVVPAAGDFATFIDSHSDEIATAAEKIRNKKSLEPFLILRRRYADAKSDAGRYFDHLLQNCDLDASYQAARYDGKLRGTLAAMILFYTDLTAKLWALDFQGMAPRHRIRGFRTMDEIRVPRLYWEDFVRLSKTRLWFGLKPDGFDIDGDTLRFAPGATRVYAASSDPLYPGKETKPNYQSAEFLGWWDRHYNALADFEPQFHRLNQIQKWGCIFVVLKEKKSSILDFLFTLPATRNFDFETWYKNTEGLTNRTTLPFLDREKYHRSTECFLLLRSKDYPLMGQRFFLSGGVSLASRSDILAKLKKSRSRDTTAGNTAPGQRKPGSEVRRLPKQGIAGDRGGAGTTSGPEEKKADPFGTISAEKRENTVKLQWNRGGIVLAEDFAEALVSRQENRVTGYKDERIFNGLSDVEKVVRLERGKRYLVRMKEMHDRWVYLKINDIAEKKEFPVQLAGTEPDSDIFFAKLVSDRQMETLRTGGTCEELVDPSIIPH